MSDLKILIVQPDVIWKDINGNLAKYSDLLSKRQVDPDLILFPEMFQTGFCSDPADVSETMDGHTIRWMKRTAESIKCAIAGSMIIKDGRKYFNRIIYIDQFENLTWYDKRHLFSIDGEEMYYTPGRKKLIVPLREWMVSFQVCYDLRFPVWARNKEDYDVLINLANWPAKRDDVWTTLLKARAIENQCYTIGVNRVGTDFNNIYYRGNSMVTDPKGTITERIEDSAEGLLHAILSKESLDKFRSEFPVWKDADDFDIRI
ncbi:MAG TPA: amidohydrolase [Bacteroidales bacterium]|jgi:predicted amidohydrolase|nr:amidohydrolase [Bacteroidales bacterium]